MLVTDYKCRVCKCDLDEDNCSYEDEICDDCYEKECDEQLAEKDE
jgi:hypothetical protein